MNSSSSPFISLAHTTCNRKRTRIAHGIVGVCLILGAAAFITIISCTLNCDNPRNVTELTSSNSAHVMSQRTAANPRDQATCSNCRAVFKLRAMHVKRLWRPDNCNHKGQVTTSLGLRKWYDVSVGSIKFQQQQQHTDITLDINRQFHKAARYASPIQHAAWYQASIANATLLSWEAKVSSTPLPDCPKGAWFDLAVGGWYITLDGELLYEPKTCKLRRFTATAARTCLANTTLTFVGGSLTRYQYLSMAHFISRGHHMQRYADDGLPSLAIERTWAGFNEFYHEGSKLLQHSGPGVEASEVCDCHRVFHDATTREDRTLTVKVFPNAITSAATAMDKHKSSTSVVIGYRQAFGLKSNVLTETVEGISKALSNSTSAQNVMVVNIGHWFHKGIIQPTTSYQAVAAVYEPVLQELAAKAQASNGSLKLVWKTVTATHPTVPSGLNDRNPIAAEARPGFALDWNQLLATLANFHGWDVMDAFAVTKSLVGAGVNGFWDSLHYLPFVYDQLNDVLLNGLC